MRLLTIFVSLFLHVFSTSIAASEKVVLANSDNKRHTDTALENILPEYCFFSGNFKQIKLISKIPVPLLSSGQLFFSCQHGLIWRSQEPFDESLVYTEKNIHFRSIDNELPVVLDGPKHHYLAKFLLDILSSDIESIYKNFSVNLTGGKAKFIELLPTNTFAKKGLEKITIKKQNINLRDNLKINIIDNRKQETKIEISNIDGKSKNKESNVTEFCNAYFLDSRKTCSMLLNPQQYQPTTSEN